MPDSNTEKKNSSNKPSETTCSTDVVLISKDIQDPQYQKRQAPPLAWKPGQSGNPAGRPKGIRNKITILKEELEYRLRDRAAPKIEKVLDKAFELALQGDRMMIKLLVELHMSRQQHTEDEKGGKSQVAVIVQNLTDSTYKPPIKVIDNNG